MPIEKDVYPSPYEEGTGPEYGGTPGRPPLTTLTTLQKRVWEALGPIQAYYARQILKRFGRGVKDGRHEELHLWDVQRCHDILLYIRENREQLIWLSS